MSEQKRSDAKKGTELGQNKWFKLITRIQEHKFTVEEKKLIVFFLKEPTLISSLLTQNVRSVVELLSVIKFLESGSIGYLQVFTSYLIG